MMKPSFVAGPGVNVGVNVGVLEGGLVAVLVGVAVLLGGGGRCHFGDPLLAPVFDLVAIHTVGRSGHVAVDGFGLLVGGQVYAAVGVFVAAAAFEAGGGFPFVGGVVFKAHETAAHGGPPG